MAKKYNRDFPLAPTFGGPGKGLAGENTGKIEKNKAGKLYSTVLESTDTGLVRGDTIMVGKKPIADGYIMGGDYTVKKIGKKKYK